MGERECVCNTHTLGSVDTSVVKILFSCIDWNTDTKCDDI